ncbi:hypothetical protein EXIGLDRAFT_843487 [Exidia glandulosa HHB12029]|uniref:F-box domain-containing protein n=1 Tax=Exidia glandulosa HHB12029 TaxID=1314781 RepID=A0A165CM67_EXIGL|nr:hypothetical protein EXIGLDRAFT_843487 [Exidia glandulosa HHB12029]
MAARLAPETLAHVISYLHGEHRSIQRLTGVCRFWRAVARDHPLYWRHIQIADVWSRPSSLDAFLSRIAYGAEHKPNVSIRITAECSRGVEGEHHEEARRTSHTILKTVALHTHRLRSLKLTLGLEHLRFFADCHRETLLEFPCLVHLHLYLAMPLEERMSYSGPPLLFPPFRAPRVTALVLFDMLLTNPGTLCGTGGLEVLSLHCHGIKAPQLSAILTPFPRIERLYITLGKGVHSHTNTVTTPAPILKHLSLVLFSCNSLSVLRSISRSTIPPSLKTFDYYHSTVGSVPTAPQICLRIRQPILFSGSPRTEGIIVFATPDHDLLAFKTVLYSSACRCSLLYPLSFGTET